MSVVESPRGSPLKLKFDARLKAMSLCAAYILGKVARPILHSTKRTNTAKTIPSKVSTAPPMSARSVPTKQIVRLQGQHVAYRARPWVVLQGSCDSGALMLPTEIVIWSAQFEAFAAPP